LSLDLSGMWLTALRICAASDRPRPKAWHKVLGMPAPPVAKTDLRPWRSQIDALLAGIAMNPVVRAASLDSFEEHGLLAYTNTKPEIAVDELGRLNKSRVEKALENFDEHVQVQVVSVLESLHAMA
jgi:hypothetical protein